MSTYDGLDPEVEVERQAEEIERLESKLALARAEIERLEAVKKVLLDDHEQEARYTTRLLRDLPREAGLRTEPDGEDLYDFLLAEFRYRWDVRDRLAAVLVDYIVTVPGREA